MLMWVFLPSAPVLSIVIWDPSMLYCGLVGGALKPVNQRNSDQVLIVMEIRCSLVIDIDVRDFTQGTCFVYSDLGSVYVILRLCGRSFNPYPAAKVYTSAISTAAKVSVNKCSTEDAYIPPLSPYSIFILMFTIINIIWKLKSKE